MRALVCRAAFVVLACVAIAPRAGAAPAGAYHDPSFASACAWQQFGEGEQPDPLASYGDPLCVEYQKRDITLSNGGAASFAAAEPARFAIAARARRYWQVDHWSVQVSPGDVPIVTWDGSYWWDMCSGTGGARMTNFRVMGVAMGPSQAADYVEPYSPAMAAGMREYGDSAGGGGVGFNAGGGMACAQ